MKTTSAWTIILFGKYEGKTLPQIVLRDPDWFFWEKHETLFQTGWFVESLMTQTLIIHVIRSNRIPFLQTQASWPLIATSVVIMAIGIWLPYSPLAPYLGFTELPPLYWPILVGTLLGYVTLTQVVKTWLHRKGWI